jgi:hypothetical protein
VPTLSVVVPVYRADGSLRELHRRLVATLEPEGIEFEINLAALLTWATTRFGAVKVRHQVRQIGESGYKLRKLITHAVKLMAGFSTLPLQIACVMGFAFALFGFLILASIIANFSRVQLCALDIIGEYLARMHFRSMDQPPYAIREQVGQPLRDLGA